ncbi:SPW repeat-containing protein [Prauserella shujinwangii]|uniref:SPW repeat-containing protein n=1 Tax=Prauserella shujinwangii TaxID=1453103 RepID=A0A2T0LZ84_9PSEU|nr:SPW repeat protein [Prauserella shujinwangii]PRX49436.1 SPW repeat-containing protein [Prauserella shujinwangii]
MADTSATSARPWTRPHDWAEVVLGVVLALSPLWLDTSTAAMWTMIVLGALIAIDGLASLAMPGMVYGEGIQIVLGALAVVSPWVMSYTDLTGAAWTSWIVGALTIIAGAAALPLASTAHRTAGQH